MIRVHSGTARLGADFHEADFGWDNEFPEIRVDVPEFRIDSLPVTNVNFSSSLNRMRTTTSSFGGRKIGNGKASKTSVIPHAGGKTHGSVALRGNVRHASRCGTLLVGRFT
jgi:formylglycine-generating enzyme required for sulfatase activity